MHIFTMRPDGSDPRPVTTGVPAGGATWVAPQWAPSGLRIAASIIDDNAYLLEPTAAGGWRQVTLPRVEAANEAFRPGAWFRDERRIAGVTDRSRQLVVYDVDRRTYDETGLRGFEPDRGVAWLPGGQRLLLIRAGTIVLVDLASREASTVFDPPAQQAITGFSLTSDGRRLFYILVANESDIALMKLK